MNKNKRLKEINLNSNSPKLNNIKEFLDFQRFEKFQKVSKALEEEEKKHKSPPYSNNIWIPLSIFDVNLGALETICKYLKENLNLNNKKIAQLLNRNSRIVWNSCNSSKKKLPRKFNVKSSEVSFPTKIFENDRLSALENIVSYLKDEKELSYHEIALLLKRDDRTVWTVYNRGLKKR